MTITINTVREKLKAHEIRVKDLESYVKNNKASIVVDEAIRDLIKDLLSKETVIIFLYGSLLRCYEDRTYEDQSVDNFIEGDNENLIKFSKIIADLYE